MPAPIYIMYGPLDVYVAAGGTAVPTYVTTAPSGSWTALGTNKSLDFSESGVKISHPQSFDIFRGQHSGPVAMSRTEEDLMVEFELADVAVANFAAALNAQTVTTVAASAGVPGSKAIEMYRGPGKVTPIALLLRGANSPSMDGGVAEFYVPYAVQEGNVESVFSKTGPRLLKFVYRAVESPSGGATRLGTYREQTAAAS